MVCGINRYKSPVELWMEKTDQMPSQEAGEAAYWGTQLEPFVRAEFTKRTGIEVIHTMQLLQSEEHPFMLANLDGICDVPDVGKCIFEAKTASAYKASEWEDTIPDEYMLQVQHYMAVTGYRGTYIAALIGGNSFKWKFVERDEELISMLIELEANFWNHVEELTVPPLDGSAASAKFLAERFHDSIPKSHITLPDTAADLLAQYDEACEELEIVTERKQMTLMDMGRGLVQMERPVNDVDVFPEAPLQLHHKFSDDFQKHFRGNGVLHCADLVDGFLRAEAFISQQIIHAPVTLRVAAFGVPLMLAVKVIRVAVQIKGTLHIREGNLPVLLGRIGYAPKTIPINVL